MTTTPKPAPLTEAELAELKGWSISACLSESADLVGLVARAIATIEAQREQLERRDAEWTRAVVPWWSMTLTPDKAVEKVEQLYTAQREMIRRLREALETEHDAAEYSLSVAT